MKHTIVIIDDDEVIRLMLQEVLKNEGLRIVTFADCQQALDYIENNQVAVVVTDIMLPGMKGNELIKDIRERNAFVQIVVVTAYPTLALFLELGELGVADVLIKPSDCDEVLEVILSALKRHMRWQILKRSYVNHKKFAV